MIARLWTYARARFYEVRAERARLTYLRLKERSEVFFARLSAWVD